MRALKYTSKLAWEIVSTGILAWLCATVGNFVIPGAVLEMMSRVNPLG